MQNSVVGQMESRHGHQHARSSRAGKTISFIWHLAQMIGAMEIGMLLYHGVFVNQLAPASYKFATIAYPLFDYWMMMIAMTLPMILVMRYHKHDWRYCGGMAIAVLAPVALLSGLKQFDLISIGTLKTIGGITMNLAMVIYMLPAERNADAQAGHSAHF